jgi:Fe-S-cluster containining protein
MYQFYKTKYSDGVLKKSRKELKRLYEQVPETEGCKENIAKEGGCGAWCCEHQTPMVMYAEFLNTWNTILNMRPADKIASLLVKAVRLYLNGKPTKGCIFWDRSSKLCTQHSTRPLNCRVYGQIPDEEFKPRYERLKVMYKDSPSAVIREQCGIVKSVGIRPTKKDTDTWQHHLEQIEAGLVPKDLIHDRVGGSYRTYHDHILLRMGNPDFLAELTDVRLTGTKEQKEEYVAKLVAKLKKTHPYLEETEDEDAGRTAAGNSDGT